MVINDWWGLARLGPLPASESLAKILHEGGISRVVTGHRPFGDSPTILRKNGIEVLVGDTSYSDMSAPDSRGKALYFITINGTLKRNSTHIIGKLHDGSNFDFNLPTIDEKGTDYATKDQDTLIGTEIDDRFWIKAKLENGKHVAMKADGRNISYKQLDFS